MANVYLSQLLGENEKTVLITRQHWFVLLGRIAPGLALVVLILIAVSTALVSFSAGAGKLWVTSLSCYPCSAWRGTL